MTLDEALEEIERLKKSIEPAAIHQDRDACPAPKDDDVTYYSKGKDAQFYEALPDKEFAWEVASACMDLNDTGLGGDLDKWMPFQVMIADAGKRIERLMGAGGASSRIRAEGRQANQSEVQEAIEVIGLANGHDLDTLTGGAWPDDAMGDAVQFNRARSLKTGEAK